MNIQLKIALQGSQPPIWRRVLVSEESTLLDLHDLIQFCFNWQDYHLHRFEITGMAFVHVEDWEEDGDLYQDDSRARLGDLIPRFVPEGKSFDYRYDFGDDWLLKVKVEKIIPESPSTKPPCILGGRRAAPPEDVGGIWGYAEFLEALQDPGHPEHDSYVAWIGGSFDPEAFDAEAADQSMKKALRNRAQIRASTWPVGPLYADFRGTTHNPWTESLPEPLKSAAADLPLRRDMVTLLTYLKNHKVKGSKARGNFPRKDIRAITADFVNPPVLDVKIGDRVWQLQSEDEVQDLLRYHLLACVSGLIFGGENLLWELLPQGEVFLNLPPENQVWYLSHVWFRHFNWIYEYDAPEDWPFMSLKASVVAHFSAYPVGEDIPISQVIGDLTNRREPGGGVQMDEDDTLDQKYFLLRAVIQPLGTFGILKVNESNPMDPFWSEVTGIRVPELGHHIFEEQQSHFERS